MCSPRRAGSISGYTDVQSPPISKVFSKGAVGGAQDGAAKDAGTKHRDKHPPPCLELKAAACSCPRGYLSEHGGHVRCWAPSGLCAHEPASQNADDSIPPPLQDPIFLVQFLGVDDQSKIRSFLKYTLYRTSRRAQVVWLSLPVCA